MKKIFKGALLLILIALVVVVLYAVITFPPVMAGMAAKTVCSCVYVSGRTLSSVLEKELQVFPGLAKATIEFHHKDSTVTAKILWRKSTAIYRRGLGCTLLATRTEDELRRQAVALPSPAFNQDSIRWPMGDKTDGVLSRHIKSEVIDKALIDVFEEKDLTKPINTHAVIVVYDGQIIGEKYASGFDMYSKLMGWSMAKSVTNALIGVLVEEGKLKTMDPAPVPEWKDDERRGITLDHLLHATSGLSWSESYFVPTSDFHDMFIRSDDKGAYAASRKLKYLPGEVFEYSSGTTNILSRIIRHTLGDQEYYRFPYEKLFYKIGMNNTILEPDPSGTFVGSSYAFATARDWARFGMLYQNDGIWNGEQVLPKNWVSYSTTPSSAATMGEYGAQWWLNHGSPENSAVRKYPELPADAYWADGFEEQFVMVIPSKKLVIVRLGVSHHGFDFTNLALNILNALPQ